MKVINENPLRYELSRTEMKKKLFSKEEVTKYAIGDEDGNPITEFSFDEITPFENGFALCKVYHNQHLRECRCFNLNGEEMMAKYADKGYYVERKGDYFTLTNIVASNPTGLAAADETLLIDPKDTNYMEIIDDFVLYGDASPVPEASKFGAIKLSGGKGTEILPQKYSFIKYIGNRVFAAGRCVTSTSTQAASLTRDTVITTGMVAFQLYSADSGKISDMIFSDIHQTKKGNYSATVCPKIKPEELLHRQTTSEAFSGEGLMDFSKTKNVVLNENFEIM